MCQYSVDDTIVASLILDGLSLHGEMDWFIFQNIESPLCCTYVARV